MNKKNIQEILPFVEMPSRYLGSEVNTIKKDHRKVDLKFALCFPDLYEIGTSHFGIQILYSILNSREQIAAERFFTPAPDMEKLLKEKNIPLFSLESKTDLRDFDIIGFSLLYELNFTNILTMLDLSKIPFHAEKRDDSFPLIIAGGPCAFNPEPLADFFDAFVIGDGEEVVLEISDVFIKWKKNGDHKKKTLLKRLSEIRGVYIPSFFVKNFNSRGIQTLTPVDPCYKTIKRSILADLKNSVFPGAPIVPFGKPVHDRLRLEIARGCSRGCRFCQAGMIYRPVRERSLTDLEALAEKGLNATGYSDISLLSLSTGDYSSLAQLMEKLLSMDQDHCTAISLPSIRAGRLTPELMKIIKKVKKTGFTIAPEAGTQRLRDVINKNITEKDIFDTVTNAFELGWSHIKLYFMTGLPTETMEDIDAICDLASRLSAVKSKGRGKKKGKAKVNVSFATFIPKPHTPFQRCAQIPMEKAEENLTYLKKHLGQKSISLKWQNPEMSLLEGVFARGDRRLSDLLVSAWKKGCRLDGWSDMFRFDRWKEAFTETGIDPCFFTSRKRDENEILPWDHIDSGVSPEFLKKEFQKSMIPELTADCRESKCTGCGICDFKEIQPVLYKKSEHTVSSEESVADTLKPDSRDHKNAYNNGTKYIKMRVFYSRLEDARFLGHLELAKIIKRAVRRTGIKVKYTMGFNPGMKISFDNPLPVGMESEEEFFNLSVETGVDPIFFTEKLNLFLPAALSVTRSVYCADLKKKDSAHSDVYRISFKDYSIDRKCIDDFMNLSVYVVEQTSFKGKKRTIDLRKATKKITLSDPCSLEMVLTDYQNRTIRPADILTQVFEVPVKTIQAAKIIRLKTE